MKVWTWLCLVGLAVACNGEERACDERVVEIEECYDAHCDGDGADTPFCGCWNQGQDVDVTTCECVPLGDLSLVCDLADPRETVFDCDAAASAVSNMCN